MGLIRPRAPLAAPNRCQRTTPLTPERRVRIGHTLLRPLTSSPDLPSSSLELSPPAPSSQAYAFSSRQRSRGLPIGQATRSGRQPSAGDSRVSRLLPSVDDAPPGKAHAATVHGRRRAVDGSCDAGHKVATAAAVHGRWDFEAGGRLGKCAPVYRSIAERQGLWVSSPAGPTSAFLI